jgi:hypothetical protein
MGPKQGGTNPYQPDAPGWYPDPWSATGGGERYFDGKRWGTNERPRARHSDSVSNVVAMKSPRARGTRGVKAFLARFRIPIILVLIAAVAVALWVRQESQRNSVLGGIDRTIGVTRPPPGTEEAPTRLMPKPALVNGPGHYEFQHTQPGQKQTPVAFDPCRPIHWVYSPANEPADGLAIAQDGFTTLAGATGLKFVYDGTTAEAPERDRNAYLPDRYDRTRWAPVLVGWANESQFRDLVGHVTGVTRPDVVTLSDGRSVFVSGVVVLDAADLAVTAVPDRSIVRATMLHELGHLVGLDHTTDRTQLMFSETLGVRDYANGDLQGLALEGSQACFPEI